jgi:4-hydroxythreonine-4-phosphate dehydrogenase
MAPLNPRGLPLVAITMGDPAGIGPEIIMKALAAPETYELCRSLVVGDAGRLRRAAQICHVDLDVVAVEGPEQGRYEQGRIDCIDLDMVPENLAFGELSKIGGETAYRAVEQAARLAVEGRVDAICTAPLNKEALHLAGHHYPGHTEILADLTGTPEVSMMLTCPKVRVIHVTTHIGLLEMVEQIESGLVYRTIKRGYDTLVRAGITNPHIAVCGINPHAGEHGLFGQGEEEKKVAPGVAQARSAGINAEGPLAADSVFFRAGRGDFDLVVAMYHDQGHGPVKILGLEAGVNITVGLPVIRTSVDHGTAFDIAGKDEADHRSMIEALRQAAQLAGAAASRAGKDVGAQ